MSPAGVMGLAVACAFMAVAGSFLFLVAIALDAREQAERRRCR